MNMYVGTCLVRVCLTYDCLICTQNVPERVKLYLFRNDTNLLRAHDFLC